METLSVYSDNSALAQAAYSNLGNGVIEFFLSPLLRYKQESLGER